MFDTVEDLEKALYDIREVIDTTRWTYSYVDEKYGFVNQKIETGGWSGGSCWGDEAEKYETDESFDDNESPLDKFFENYYPNISFLNYRKIIQEVLSVKKYTDYEYYGNSTDFEYEIIDMQKLFEMLKEF